ncbi:MAG: HK97 gp10 family phage protein [Pseudomonadota bacterium]
MTQSFTAQVRAWSEKAKRNAGLVIADAAQEVFKDMSQRQPGVKETGGTFEIGKVPVGDSGLLANSMLTTLNGAAVGSGPEAYVAGLAGFELGDTIIHAFTQEYAMRIEYGFQGTDSLGRSYDQQGRFMVREAINGAGGWQSRIDTSAAKFRD